MCMKDSEIKRILKENKKAFEMLENYDKTGELPKIKEKTGKPISQIIEDKI